MNSRNFLVPNFHEDSILDIQETLQAEFSSALHRGLFIHSAPNQFIMEGDLIVLEGAEYVTKQLFNNFAATASIKEQLYVLGRIPTHYKGFIGRGTVVSVAKMGTVGESFSDRDYARNFSLQFSARSHDGDVIFRSSTPPTSASREAKVEMLNEWTINIWEAKSVEEFKCIFVDCLECHHHAWKTRNVLHRDVSINNLMVYQPRLPERGPLSKDVAAALSRGGLSDFNMAFELREDSKAQLEAHHRRVITGTLPFMARDLVLRLKRAQNALAIPAEETPDDRIQLQAKDRDPKEDLYPYSLESFF